MTTAVDIDLRTLRRQNRLKEERLKAARLADAEADAKRTADRRQVRESVNYRYDWVSDYLKMYQSGRDVFAPVGIAGRWARKNGRNYPVFQNEADLALLRFPSRWLCATNPYAIGVVNGIRGYVLGSGLTYRAVAKDRDLAEQAKPVVKAVQDVIDTILEENEWYGGELPGFEGEYFDRTLEDGEGIALHFPGRSGMTQFRFAEPEQLTMPIGEKEDVYSFGVKVDPLDMQKPAAYWIQWSDDARDGEEFEKDRVTHFRRNVKRSIKRGVPEFSFDTFESLDDASKLRGNMGDAAGQQASIVGAMKFKTGTQQEIQRVADADTDFYSLDFYRSAEIGVRKSKRGGWEYLPDSQEYTNGPAATNAVAHYTVLQMLLRAVAVRWNAPEWLASSDASNNNYASGQTAERNFANRVQTEQKRYTAVFRRMIWQAVEHYVRTRGLNGLTWDDVDRLVQMKVEAPAPVAWKPLDEAQIAAIEIPLGVQSRQGYAQDKGRDWDEIEADNADYEADHPGPISPKDAAAFMADGGDAGDASASQGAAP